MGKTLEQKEPGGLKGHQLSLQEPEIILCTRNKAIPPELSFTQARQVSKLQPWRPSFSTQPLHVVSKLLPPQHEPTASFWRTSQRFLASVLHGLRDPQRSDPCTQSLLVLLVNRRNSEVLFPGTPLCQIFCSNSIIAVIIIVMLITLFVSVCGSQLFNAVTL